MPRVNRVKKARKDQGTCRCGHVIKAGESYQWAKPRYGAKMVRCANCSFSRSDLTSSDKLARIYDAQDSAADEIGSWSGDDGHDALAEILRNAAQEANEVADEYEESAENIREHFESSSTADECEERAEEIRSWAEEMESAADELEEFDEDTAREEARSDLEDDDGKVNNTEVDGAVETAREEWASDARDKADEAIGNCPV